MTEEQKRWLLKGINMCSPFMSMLEREEMLEDLELQDIKLFDKDDIELAYESGHYDGLIGKIGGFDDFYIGHFKK